MNRYHTFNQYPNEWPSAGGYREPPLSPPEEEHQPESEDEMTRVCIDEATINEVAKELKADIRRDWRPKGFNPVKFTRYLEVTEDEDVRLVVTFNIPGNGEQEVTKILKPETKAPSPQTETP